MQTLKFFLAITLALPCLAGIAGKWDVTSTTNEGQTIKSSLLVKETEGKLDATLSFGERAVPISNLTFADDQLSFRLMWSDTGVTVKVRLDGDNMKGTWVADTGDTGPVAAVRGAEAAASANSIAGKWKLTAARPDREPIKVDLDLKEEAGKWIGTLITPDGMTLPATSVVLEGSSLTVKLATDNGNYTLKLAPDGPNMKGTAEGPEGPPIPLTATR